MESIEGFKKLRDSCDEIIKAYERDDEEAIEVAIGKFIFLCMQLEAIK